MVEPQLRSPRQPPNVPPTPDSKAGIGVRLLIYVILALIGAYGAFVEPIVRGHPYNRYAAMAVCGLGTLMAAIALIRLGAGTSRSDQM